MKKTLKKRLRNELPVYSVEQYANCVSYQYNCDRQCKVGGYVSPEGMAYGREYYRIRPTAL